MSKTEFKELVKIVLFSVINLVISFSITNFFGISNIVIHRSFTALYGDITWEVVIFLFLSLIEVLVYALYKSSKNSSTDDL